MSNKRIPNYRELCIELATESNWCCEVCGQPLNGTGLQLAHRIPGHNKWRKKYGDDVIDHKFNLAAVCSLKCNAAVLVRGDVTIENLVKKIKKCLT